MVTLQMYFVSHSYISYTIGSHTLAGFTLKIIKTLILANSPMIEQNYLFQLLCYGKVSHLIY